MEPRPPLVGTAEAPVEAAVVREADVWRLVEECSCNNPGSKEFEKLFELQEPGSVGLSQGPS